MNDKPKKQRSGGSDSANAIALDSAGRAIIAGQATGLFGLVRLLGNAATPTAAQVFVGGRVTTANGAGIRNATLTQTDANGQTRYARSGAFGFYRFGEVPAGETYI